ncbi:MAG: hypothetical protein E7633_10730 [Ruminococcaceae bacterium]|nr:hypothetical protein [Oscillospiraceae bacterium]
MKNRYIELMDKALDAYTYEHILSYFDKVKNGGFNEHGFARLTANMGIMIANGRRKEYIPIFLEMMDFCCYNMPTVKAANDFTVKEIIFCIMALEENGTFENSRIDGWKASLATIEVPKCYSQFAKTPQDKVYNWACFTMLSEFMREYIGIADTKEFVDIQIPTQLQWLDENGMYRDPNNPMVYDLVPRGLLSVLLNFGYKGRYYSEIDEALRKSGLLTLKMQSVTGEIPFGGRSNQFPHNEAHLLIVFEYEAKRYAREGNTALASQFKRGAEKALDNVDLWLSQYPIRHVKNYFDTATKYGCENYAYFDKYMITTASFLYAAYLLCDESIPVAECESDTRYVMQLSKHFHKILARNNDYFIEIDTNADPHYDACGLGRVHKKGAPSTVCMSVPCTSTPNYTVDVPGAIDLSLCAGVVSEGETIFATGKNTKYEVLKLDEANTEIELKNTFENGRAVISKYALSADGLDITVSGEGEIAYMLPAFEFDGRERTEINVCGNRLEIIYKGWTCIYTASAPIYSLNKVGCNRNGHYKAYYAKSEKSLEVKIEIAEKK